MATYLVGKVLIGSQCDHIETLKITADSELRAIQICQSNSPSLNHLWTLSVRRINDAKI